MAFSTPASASSAEVKAFATPIAFRLTHGISTRPATGSQTRPSTFASAVATAFPIIRGVPPASSTTAAAAIAAAEPHSAWQPPSAPARHALFAITMPTAEAVKRDITQARSDSFLSACMVRTAAGRIPLLPAVGAATMRPMEAFSSEIASARYRAPPKNGPVRFFPKSTACFIL